MRARALLTTLAATALAVSGLALAAAAPATAKGGARVFVPGAVLNGPPSRRNWRTPGAPPRSRR